MKIVLDRIGLIRPAVVVRWLLNWWLREFLNLLPERAVEWLSDERKVRLLLGANEGDVSLNLQSGKGVVIASGAIDRSSVSSDSIDRFLKAHGVDPDDADVGLQLPDERIFKRRLRLPTEAIRTIDSIVKQDLARKTPFKHQEIYSDYVTLPDGGNDRIVVHQWIVQSQYVEDAISGLNVDPKRLVFVTSDGAAAPFVRLSREDNVPNIWLRKATLALTCSAIFLAIVAGGLKYWLQQREMDRLSAEIVIKNKRAQQVRSLIDQLHAKKGALLQLRLRRAEVPGLLDLWEEVTRIVPSHTWLAEFRLSEGGSKREEQMSISGFSSAAPGLVSVIDGSPLFLDAALTSPVAFDPVEGRERFSLQAKVRAPELKESGR